MSQTLWGGRFSEKMTDSVLRFTTSIHEDYRLWKSDIQASIAHAKMLGAVGVISVEESEQLIQGLKQVQIRFETENLPDLSQFEDVHSVIEHCLTEAVGQVAGKLHTGRSRNDQVITATRLYCRDQVKKLLSELKAIQTSLLEKSKQHLETVLPGLTHTQHAQPVSLAHHFLAYFWMFQRDRQRLSDALKRMNISPLGSAALAGSPFPLDRQKAARDLGFDSVTENSLDAVSDRDFIFETLAALSIIGNHISKLSEEWVLWSTPEFAYIEFSDSVTTGSSIMPQKKNPDVAELLRGRSAKPVSALVGLLMTAKALPLAYNRDLQEDKQYLWMGLDSVQSSLEMVLLCLNSMKIHEVRMLKNLSGDFSNTTDLADDLAKKGMPFRQAHEVAGSVVKYCIENSKKLELLTLDELKKFSTLVDENTLKAIQFVNTLNARNTEGGTSPQAVRAQIQKAEASLHSTD